VAPVALAAQRSGAVRCSIVATGQHEELVDRALAGFGVAVDHRLAIGARSGGSQAELLGRLLPALDRLLVGTAPDVVLVQGDTASALAGAMAGVWHRLRVVHLEAGLRSHDVAHPFPEETYRRLIADLATLHLAPTPAAVANLRAEGTAPEAIVCIGNTVVDAARHVADRAGAPATMTSQGHRLVLLTIHRRENWGEPLDAVMAAMRRLVRRIPDIEVVVPVHPNPIVRDAVLAGAEGVERLRPIEPLEHAALIDHLRAATLVLTDSGGIQEEAPSFATPVLVLRETTERPEAVDAGCAVLVGTDPDAIVDRAASLLEHEPLRAAMAHVANPFGDGRSGQRAVEATAWHLGAGARPADWRPSPSVARTIVEVGR
jgi:UDP-N-acetylglucosamine 2-epimerase (non-hydrolysing)